MSSRLATFERHQKVFIILTKLRRNGAGCLHGAPGTSHSYSESAERCGALGVEAVRLPAAPVMLMGQNVMCFVQIRE